MDPKVSIVIPCYNDMNFIAQAVSSAWDQTYRNKEIIVVDDGSNKETKNRLGTISNKIDVLITQTNKGVIEARNKGISEARGEFIVTLDSDDYFEPSFIEKAINIISNDSRIGMVTSWMEIVNESGQHLRIHKPTGASAFKAMFYNNAPASLLFRKKCWEEVGGYDIKLNKGYEDWEFNIAVGRNKWGINVIPEVLHYYRSKSVSRNKAAKKYYDQIRCYTYKKHQELLIENMDETIDLFLNEIQRQKGEIERLKNSESYKLGEIFYKPLRKIRSKFF